MSSVVSNERFPGSGVASSALEYSDELVFEDEFDVLVVGFGGAGAAAALQALEQGASVGIVDRFNGGGATAICGSVIYAGGGTALQQRLGVNDSAENMFEYLRQEVDGVVSDETLRDFCDNSAGDIDWLTSHGLRFSHALYPSKTTYPPAGHSLYPSGNELDINYQQSSYAAARGHIPDGIPDWSAFGPAIYAPLAKKIAASPATFLRQCRASRLIVDADGVVRGLEVEDFAASRWSGFCHRLWSRMATALHMYHQPSADFCRRRLVKLEASSAVRKRLFKVRRGVILAAGGFIFNRQMVDKYCSDFAPGMRLGTTADDGSGIALGAAAGGAVQHLDRASAWRFINPPAIWPKAILVDRAGARFVNEGLYGAVIGTKMMREHNAEGLLIMDSELYQRSIEMVNRKTARVITILQFKDAIKQAVSADSLESLAERVGIDAAGLIDSVSRYNRCIDLGEMDEFGKLPDNMEPLLKAPFYAIDLSASGGGVTPVITLGGLAVNEQSGEVLNEAGAEIKGLYAAGRNAVGIASNNYVTGLSVADCIYSGRRAGRHAAAQSLQ